ncbi:hypothetical protein [Escherichia coli]|uniref:GntT/GntP/DsdX family permease n=1 Tax=Escherichia coli TaxID=562 RepID=UPI003AF1EF82
MAAAAAFLVPGPAPMLLASQMNADFGWMILIGLCAQFRNDYCRPLWGNFISRYVELHIPDDIKRTASRRKQNANLSDSACR